MEALTLRRNYPLPVTFADLRRAYDRAKQFANLRAFYGQTGRMTWQYMLKETTGATDDVYAVVDGREVHVARVRADGVEAVAALGWGYNFRDLLEAADEAGYWERPHEVRIDLQERIPTIAAIGKVVQRSLIEAEVRRGH